MNYEESQAASFMHNGTCKQSSYIIEANNSQELEWKQKTFITFGTKIENVIEQKPSAD